MHARHNKQWIDDMMLGITMLSISQPDLDSNPQSVRRNHIFNPYEHSRLLHIHSNYNRNSCLRQNVFFYSLGTVILVKYLD